jgi:hypothetical protein
MQMTNIPFGTTDWSTTAPITHKGDAGEATWRTQQFDTIRVRMRTEREDGRVYVLKPGLSYQVADHAEKHRSTTFAGAKLFIVD